MIECPSCGGNLKFDIALQKMKCEYCLSTHDPYAVARETDAEETRNFDVTIFTCPQCGGEILSTDTSAAEFCSFCGASTILTSRIRNEQKPARIIPFQKTREDCKQAYLSQIKRAVFAPDELKDQKYIDSFRGIYMPYWAYHFSQKGSVTLKGHTSQQRGDYIYTKHYDISGNLDADYRGLCYDASSSFADSISESLAPFHTQGEKEFASSFLSGFYADTADVAGDVYQKDAEGIVNNTSYRKIKSQRFDVHPSFDSSNNSNLTQLLHTKSTEPERILYPVWFMSYRKNDRVAYATVNGQTGKVAADIPIDFKKYVIGSLLLSLPIVLLLNLALVLTPKMLLSAAIFLALFTIILYIVEVTSIYNRDKRYDDRGYLNRNSVFSAPDAKRKTGKHKSISAKTMLKYSQVSEKFKFPGFCGSLAALIFSVIVRIFSPVMDIWYYGCALLAFVGILTTLMALISKYNILATRALPQFTAKRSAPPGERSAGHTSAADQEKEDDYHA